MRARAKENAGFELTLFSGELSPQEMDELVRLLKQSEGCFGTKKELLDCVGVLENEAQQKIQSAVDVSKMSDEEYKAQFEKLVKNKKGK